MGHPYGATVLEHFRHPRNQGALDGATITQEGVNPLCGDRVRIQLKVQGDVVVDARFIANACAICIASASVLTDLVQRAPVDEVETLVVDDLVRALGGNLPGARMPCVSLPLTLMHTGLLQYRQINSARTR